MSHHAEPMTRYRPGAVVALAVTVIAVLVMFGVVGHAILSGGSAPAAPVWVAGATSASVAPIEMQADSGIAGCLRIQAQLKAKPTVMPGPRLGASDGAYAVERVEWEGSNYDDLAVAGVQWVEVDKDVTQFHLEPEHDFDDQVAALDKLRRACAEHNINFTWRRQ